MNHICLNMTIWVRFYLVRCVKKDRPELNHGYCYDNPKKKSLYALLDLSYSHSSFSFSILVTPCVLVEFLVIFGPVLNHPHSQSSLSLFTPCNALRTSSIPTLSGMKWLKENLSHGFSIVDKAFESWVTTSLRLINS